ncbi:MAG: 2-phospho-L-lactate guanylyltransferase [Solirubrobacterales bacterium]
MNRLRPRVCAVLPLKPFGDAKERLATGLDPHGRRIIAEAMARDVLAALPQCELITDVVVISAEPTIEAIAGEVASAILPDTRQGHSEAVMLGTQWALGIDCDAVLMIPGDCPLIDPDEIDDLIERCVTDDTEVAVIPDRMGTGTNALLLRPPDAIVPSFGPDSRARHLGLGLAAGRRTAAIEVPTLALDLDTAEDLLELAERVAAADHSAVNTEQAIAELMTDRRHLPGGYAR